MGVQKKVEGANGQPLGVLVAVYVRVRVGVGVGVGDAVEGDDVGGPPAEEEHPERKMATAADQRTRRERFIRRRQQVEWNKPPTGMPASPSYVVYESPLPGAG